MEVQIVYNNEAKKGFKSGWGFSALIKEPNKKTLFDVGWDPKILKHNINKFGTKLEEINTIFISHNHWDHIGSLPQILKKQMNIIVPSNLSKKMKKEIKKRAKLTEISNAKKLNKNKYTTGVLGQEIKEQSLIIKNQGLTIITGCSHPGLKKIIETSRKIGEIKTIIGGMHNFNQYKLLKNSEKIIPLHCTKNKEKIKSKYPQKTNNLKAGEKIII